MDTDKAPGSGCPIDFSPSVLARPIVAIMALVFSMPSVAPAATAANASESDLPTLAWPASCRAGKGIDHGFVAWLGSAEIANAITSRVQELRESA